MDARANPARLLEQSDEDLLRECTVDTFRASGPGGQKRNKTSSAVRLRHHSSGLASQATESRSQHENRDRALRRLRREIALQLREPVDLDAYEMPARLRAILPGFGGNRIGPRHRDFWNGVQALLDVFVATGYSVSDTARVLGISTGALSKIIVGEPDLLASVNQLRAQKGMRPLRQDR